jgi:hypothetical protein
MESEENERKKRERKKEGKRKKKIKCHKIETEKDKRCNTLLQLSFFVLKIESK